MSGGATNSGNLGLAYGATRDKLRVYFQGVGCEVTATEAVDAKFTADGEQCPLDATWSIAALGITSWVFESFSIDLAGKRVSFVARATRQREDGQTVDMCLKLDSELSGDFPE